MFVNYQLIECIVVQCLLCIAHCYSVIYSLTSHLFIHPYVSCHCYEVLMW